MHRVRVLLFTKEQSRQRWRVFIRSRIKSSAGNKMLVKRYMTLYIVPAPAHLSRARTDFSLQFACFYEAPSLQHARIHVPPPIGRHRVARCVTKFVVFLSPCCYYPLHVILLSCGKMDKSRLAIWLRVIYVWMCGVWPKEFTPGEISNSNPIYLIQRDIVPSMIANSRLLESIQ